MKTRILMLMILFAGIAASAQTIEVGGIQTGVWDADTVRVVADVKVADSLTIMPGTVVLFDGFYSILVTKGTSFKAQGSEDDSIRFTVADTSCFYQYNSGKGGWNGLEIERARKVLFDYCVLEYGKAADSLDKFGGALNIRGCEDVEITHSTLRCNFAREQGGAIYGINSSVTMEDCRLNGNMVYTEDNTYALYGGAAQFLKCDVTMTGMEFRANDGSPCIGGALSLDSCSVVLDRSVFVDNLGVNGGGLYLIRSNHKECKFSNLLFDNNFTYHFGGGFAVADASPEVSNVLVINNESWGVSCCGIFFYGQSSPTLRNCIVYRNYPSPENPQMDTTQMWVWTTDDFAPEFRNCIVEGGLNYIHSADYIHVFENNIDEDPLFVDAEHHDFHLQEGSPCRDAGATDTPSYVTEGLDLAGFPRVLNERIDIGPYEYSGASVPSHPSDSQRVRLVGNPLGAKSRVEFDCEMEGTVEVTVYFLTGREVISKLFSLEKSGSMEIGSMAERLAPGVYLIEVSGKEEHFTLKAVR